jgi:GT2 family glycosyltransferase
MSFDLVLTARDRKVETLRLLGSLATQKGNVQARVLFADQGLRLTPLELTSIPQKDGGMSLHTLEIEPSALSVARNEAIKMGLSSAIVAFPDDDCWYGPTVLSSVQKIFDEQPYLQCVCTNVFDPDKRLTYGGRPVGIRLPITFSNIFSLPISVGIFIRREAFEAVGARFDETLGAGTVLGSGEETELIARLLESGAEILYAGDVSVFHPVPNYDQNDARKFHAYGLGYGYISSKFVRKGHYIVILNLMNLIIRSLGGFLIFILNKNKRDVYQSRLNGVLRGSFMAFTESKNDVK